jgi:hypothetical protein
LPTAASPRRTSFTLLLGLGAVVSDILSRVVVWQWGFFGGVVEVKVDPRWLFRLVTTSMGELQLLAGTLPDDKPIM